MNKTLIFNISNNKELAKELVKVLDAEAGRVYKKRFADGEVMIKSASDVKDKDIVIIQSTSKNVNEELFSLLLLLDSVNRAGAKSVTLFMPYFAYSRQERVSWFNEPVSCEVVAKIIDTAKFDRLVCFDLHHPIIETFFKHPILNKPTTPLFYEYYKKYLKEHNISVNDVVVVAPDHNPNNRAKMLAESLGDVNTVILNKRRPRPNLAEHLEIDGKEVDGKVCILLDDIMDTGGTLVSAAELLYKHGATNVLVGATHAVMSNNCYKKLIKANITDIVVTNSIEKKCNENIHVLDLLPLIVEEINK